MDKLKCPLCENSNISFLKTHMSSWDSKEYKLYHCENCDLQWWEPLQIIPEFYEKEEVEYLKEFHKGYRTDIGKVHMSFFKNFPKNKSGLLLDIGCGDGVFLNEVKKLGFEVWGIDFDKKSIKTAKEKFKLENVYPTSLDEFMGFAKEKGLKFDIITFFEVLEHQDNPKTFMENVRELLKPGGYIAGTVPNRDRPLVTLDRKYVNTADFPPHHFLYLNKKSLEFLFSMFGFRDIFFSPVKVDFNSINSFIELIISMGLARRLNKAIKTSLINEDSISISSYAEIYGKSWRTELLKFIKMIRNITRGVIFLPLGIPLYLIINSKGSQLYFQARLAQ